MLGGPEKEPIKRWCGQMLAKEEYDAEGTKPAIGLAEAKSP